MEFKDNLERELYLSFKFFMDAYSKNECSYGLVPDSFPYKWDNTSSIAGTGYLFSALVIGSEFGFIDAQRGMAPEKKRLNKSLRRPQEQLHRLKTIMVGIITFMKLTLLNQLG